MGYPVVSPPDRDMHRPVGPLDRRSPDCQAWGPVTGDLARGEGAPSRRIGRRRLTRRWRLAGGESEPTPSRAFRFPLTGRDRIRQRQRERSRRAVGRALVAVAAVLLIVGVVMTVVDVVRNGSSWERLLPLVNVTPRPSTLGLAGYRSPAAPPRRACPAMARPRGGRCGPVR